MTSSCISELSRSGVRVRSRTSCWLHFSLRPGDVRVRAESKKDHWKRQMGQLQIHQFPTRSDNFGVLIHDPKTEATAAIDAPDAEELLAALHDKGWTLTHILVTHHQDRKSTRLNSSHMSISYAVFCLK